MTEAKFVVCITVTDPDTGGDVEVEIWKHPNGSMFGVDSSYLDRVSTAVWDPFAEKGGSLIELPVSPNAT